MFLKDGPISMSKHYIKALFLCILSFHSFFMPPLKAECVCKCVNKKVEIICKKISDVKPVCMPFTCDSGLIGEIPKINAPEAINIFKSGCESTETIDLSGDKVLLRKECQ